MYIECISLLHVNMYIGLYTYAYSLNILSCGEYCEWGAAGRHCCRCDFDNSSSQDVKGIHGIIKLYTSVNNCKIEFTLFLNACLAVFAYCMISSGYLLHLPVFRKQLHKCHPERIHHAGVGLDRLPGPLSRSVMGRCVQVLKFDWTI